MELPFLVPFLRLELARERESNDRCREWGRGVAEMCFLLMNDFRRERERERSVSINIMLP